MIPRLIAWGTVFLLVTSCTSHSRPISFDLAENYRVANEPGNGVRGTADQSLIRNSGYSF